MRRSVKLDCEERRTATERSFCRTYSVDGGIVASEEFCLDEPTLHRKEMMSEHTGSHDYVRVLIARTTGALNPSFASTSIHASSALSDIGSFSGVIKDLA